MIPTLFNGCSSKERSAILKGISPNRMIEAAGKAHGILLAPDGGAAGSGGGYARRTWTFFSREKGVQERTLKALVDDVASGIRNEVVAMGGRAEPLCGSFAYFQIQSFDYSHQGRRGAVRVTAGALARGVAVTVIMEERPD